MQFCETLNASERDYVAYSFVHEFRDVQSIPPKLFIVHRSLPIFFKKVPNQPSNFFNGRQDLWQEIVYGTKFKIEKDAEHAN